VAIYGVYRVASLNKNYLDSEKLTQICNAKLSSDCKCPLQKHDGWQSIPEHRWPQEHLHERGTLRKSNSEEPSFVEHHPNGTRFESPEAPVALEFFPYNRCTVFSCGQCHQIVLKYTEAGGYYVEQRARRIRADLIVNITNIE
jgi:hypothetical protein